MSNTVDQSNANRVPVTFSKNRDHENETTGSPNFDSVYDYTLVNNSVSATEQRGAHMVIHSYAINDFESSDVNKSSDTGMSETNSPESESCKPEKQQSVASGASGEKSDDVHDFFDNTIHAPSLTSDDMPNAELDMTVFDRDSLKRLALEKMSEEKTVFSENLGLIPADTESKVIAQKAKNTSRGVLTRKGFEDLTSSTVEDVGNGIAGHKHLEGTVFRCGACEKTFSAICKLHDHLQAHSFLGSYHFDNILKIAFPKYDTVCMSTQTAWLDDDSDCPIVEARKTRGPGRPRKHSKSTFGKGILIKPKQQKTDPSHNTTLPKVVDPVKRKRGRPRKNTSEMMNEEFQSLSQEDKIEKSKVNSERKIAKLKVKTEDGGNTWKDITSEETDSVYVDYSGVDDTQYCMDESEIDFEDSSAAVEPSKVNVQIKEPTLTVSGGKDVKKSRKRKMSVPRKVVVKSKSDGLKIINSRHKSEFKINCDLCPAKFQYTRGLLRHEMEKHAEEMKYQCESCDMKFMRKYNLDRHKLCSHTTGKARLLYRKRGGAGRILKERIARKPREDVPDVSVACEVCGKMVPETRMEIHTRIHTGERPYICHICGKGLISDKKLKRHLLIHSQVNRHTCDVCGQGFSMKYKLRTHMFQHTGHKPYLCSVCGAEFNNSTSLLHHHRTQHLGDKRFECNICGGRYGKKSQLDEHMFSHSDVRTHICKFCSKTFKHAKSLRRHEASHVSDQKFSCDQCDSKFSRKDNLERHKMCHIEVSLHCRFCRKKFLDNKPLLEHEQNHINQKRFTCRLCKEKFQNETFFNNHIEMVHQLDKDNLSWDDVLDDQKEAKAADDDIAAHNIVLSAMKMSAVPGTEQMPVAMPFSGPADTLNLSMNVAGILPTSVQDLLPTGSMHAILVSHNSTEGYTPDQNTMPNLSLVSARNMLNQSLSGQAYVSSAGMIQQGHDSQRPVLMNSMENGGALRLSADHGTETLTLVTTDNMIVHEQQQRLMQESLGSSLNMQNSGYRMQNMF